MNKQQNKPPFHIERHSGITIYWVGGKPAPSEFITSYYYIICENDTIEFRDHESLDRLMRFWADSDRPQIENIGRLG